MSGRDKGFLALWAFLLWVAIASVHGCWTIVHALS